MAIRVPTPAFQGPQQLGGLQTQAADTPFQNLQLPDTSFNARMLSQLGESGVQFGRYLREQEDERLLLELQAGIGDWERQLLYGEMPDGTGTATGGILSLEGPDAFGLTERVAQDYDAFLSSMNEQLQGLSVSGRLAAQQFAQSHRETLLDRATRLEFEQREAHNARLRAAALASAQAAAATSWASDSELVAAETRIRGTATAAAAATAASTAEYEDAVISGRDPDAVVDEIVEEAVAVELDTFYRNTIRRALLEGSSASVRRAREIFTQASESGRLRLEPDDLLIRDVTFGEERDASMSIASEMFARHPNDLSSAIEAVRAMRVPGEQEYYIIEELERRYEQAEREEEQRFEETYDALMAEAQEGRLSPTDPRLADLTTEQVTALDRTNRGLARLSDPATSDLLQMMSPRQLAEINLSSYRPRLSADEFDELRERQRQGIAALEGDQQALLAEADTVQRQGLLTQVFEGYGLGDDNNAAFRSNITRTFEAWERDYRTREGRAPNNEERRQFLDSLLTPTREANLLGRGASNLAAELIGDDATLLYPDIPVMTLVDIGQQLLDAGVEREEATIRAVADGVPAAEIARIIEVIEDTRSMDVTRENIVQIYRLARGG